MPGERLPAAPETAQRTEAKGPAVSSLRASQLAATARRHGLTVGTSNVVGNGGGGLAAAGGGEVSKNGGSDLPADICEGVAVEEKKRGATVAVAEEF